MEPLTGCLTKFGSKLQIIVCASGAYMAHICSQVDQLGLHLCALGIPALERIDSEAVSQIVKSGRMTLGFNHLNAHAQLMPYNQ